MSGNLITSIRVFTTMTILTGIIYPVSVWAIGQVTFKDNANGSLIRINDKVIGSKLIAQPFSQDKYFQPRPSAVNYGVTPDADYKKGNFVYTSGGSNLGPTNKKLIDGLNANIKALKAKNKTSEKIPLELITASASGIDPDLSLKSALWQVPRIAESRKVSEDKVREVIDKLTERPFLGFNGESRVNVLMMNLELDKLQ
ncbi:MAG: potassium-transporting ATPase subunit KdpC [Candidatus Sericytochromatia bacterium]|nr:potassium-transporting ATPase subunit KdpC [Candidatus Sericytochromatia bacterium]